MLSHGYEIRIDFQAFFNMHFPAQPVAGLILVFPWTATDPGGQYRCMQVFGVRQVESPQIEKRKTVCRPLDST